MRGDRQRRFAAMNKSVRTTAVLACAIALVAGCSPDRRDSTIDSSLSRDLQLAGQVAVQPTFQDTALSATAAQSKQQPLPARVTRRDRPAPAPTPQPQRESPAPAPEPAAAAAPAREIAAGTGISLTAGGRVCSATNRPGDKIVATVDAPVTGSNGAVIPAGSKVVLEIASVTPADIPEQSQIVFRVRALYVGDASYQVAGNVTPTSELEKVKVAGNPGSQKKKVIGGAIAGAILGQVLGHDTKSTVIGAATGAAAGTVAAKAGQRYEGCLREGATLRLALAEAVAM